MPLTAGAQAHFDALVRDLFPFIEERLLKIGEVEPFGVTLDEDGKGAILATRGLELAVDKEHFIVERLREQARSGRLSAFIIITDVDVADPSGQAVSALRFSFEDLDSSALEFFFPYRRPVVATVEYGKPFVMARDPIVLGLT